MAKIPDHYKEEKPGFLFTKRFVERTSVTLSKTGKTQVCEKYEITTVPAENFPLLADLLYTSTDGRFSDVTRRIALVQFDGTAVTFALRQSDL